MEAVRGLLAHVLQRSTSPALVLPDGSALSWRDLDDASRRYAANAAMRGAAPGDRVALVTTDRLAGVIALLGHHRAGLVHVPVNPGYQREELQHIFDDSDAKLRLFDDDVRELCAEGPELHRDSLPHDRDLALLIYTSGTTGRSKGCMLSFANVYAAVSSLSTLWGLGASDTLVHALPLFHVHGLCVALHAALLQGATTQLLERFSPQGVVDAIAQGGTVFMGVPTMYRRLIEHLTRHKDAAAVLSRARLFCSGSAALPADDLLEFERLTGHRVVERYGMSETLITLSNPLVGHRKEGSVGVPIPGVSARVIDQELQVKGPGVMQGYWRNESATAAAFDGEWLRTGDLVEQDDDGYFRLIGRLSTDILKVGGYKISTREIEDQLARFHGLVEVAVVGIPDREWGQKVVACVVVEPGLRECPTLLQELREHVQLHESKRPRALLLLEALPRNAMGKVQKVVLAERAKQAQLGASTPWCELP